jgi:hypothetical protein
MKNAQQDHWSERERAMSVGNADTLGRPRRSVLPLPSPPQCRLSSVAGTEISDLRFEVSESDDGTAQSLIT